VLHWDGTSWTTHQPAPVLPHTQLTAVSATSPSDVCAVGTANFDTNAPSHGVALHWDGTSSAQTQVPEPNPDFESLAAVRAISPTDAWAAGTTTVDDQGSGFTTFVMHWDGSRWSQVPSPGPADPHSSGALLHSISAISDSDVWVAGEDFLSPLLLHWDGSS